MDINFDEDFNTLSLLPFLESSRVVNKAQKDKLLHLLNSIIAIAIVGLEAFMGENLMEFDAQVGENLCQVRAYKIITLSKKWLCTPSARQALLMELDKLLAFKKQVEKIISNWEADMSLAFQYEKNLDTAEYVKIFLKRHGLFITLNEDVVYLAACYFLSSFSVRNNNILYSISLSRIANELGISKYQAKRLVHKYQLIVCKLGCDFIKHIAHSLPRYKDYGDIFSVLTIKADDERMVLPCYMISKILFSHATINDTPIFLSVHRVQENNPDIFDVIYFLIIEKEKKQVIVAPYLYHLLDFCIAIEAEVHYPSLKEIESASKYLDRLLKIDPINALLANTAMHPQYSGERLESLKDNPYSLLVRPGFKKEKDYQEQSLNSMRQFAEEHGCCKKIASTLFMRHVYASKVRDQVHHLHSRYEGKVYDAYYLLNTAEGK